MKIFSFWTLLVALSISAVAAYYSIVGLAAIFAAALVPIIIMGSVLEIAKITTAVWLHVNWSESNKLIRSYLTIATVILMLITSMGIFGFLSKAHIEQVAVGGEYQARIEQLRSHVSTEETKITRNTEQIATLENNAPARIQRIQDQINVEQGRIDQIMKRIQPAIAEQESIIANSQERIQQRIQPLNDTVSQSRSELEQLTEERSKLNSGNSEHLASASEEISQLKTEITLMKQSLSQVESIRGSKDRQTVIQLQTLIGIDISKRDGVVGPSTISAYNQYVLDLNSKIANSEQRVADLQQQIETEKTQLSQQRETRISQIDARIKELNEIISTTRSQIDSLLAQPDDQSVAARQRITEIRAESQPQIDAINQVLGGLREQLTSISDTSDREQIVALEKDIQTSRDSILDLTSQIFSIESQIRSLEAEVGPVKYIAQLIYGESSDITTLEKSVRIVILMLVFVFDPLAIVLVIAAISTIQKQNSKIINTNVLNKDAYNNLDNEIEEVEILEEPEFVNENIPNKNSNVKRSVKKKSEVTPKAQEEIQSPNKLSSENTTNMVIKKK